MSRISIVNQNGATIVSNKLSSAEKINQREVELLARGNIQGLIPVFVINQRGSVLSSSKIEGKISLAAYFQGIITKKIFMDIVVQIIEIIRRCEKNVLYVKNLALDFDYIFIDLRTKEIDFIYWPVVNSQTTINVVGFLNELAFRGIFNRNEDNEYINEYIAFFKKGETFSLNHFEKFIAKYVGAASVMNKQHAPSGNLQSKNPDVVSRDLRADISQKAAYYPPTSNTISSSQEVVRSLLQQVPTGTPFVVNAPMSPSYGTTVLGAEEGDGTTVIGAAELDIPTFPYLIREKTREKIIINLPVFRIGKKKELADYYIHDNNAISRKHAELITLGKRYFIKDAGSTNKTYVNDKAIGANQNIEIFPGTKIRFANDEYTFSI